MSKLTKILTVGAILFGALGFMNSAHAEYSIDVFSKEAIQKGNTLEKSFFTGSNGIQLNAMAEKILSDRKLRKIVYKFCGPNSTPKNEMISCMRKEAKTTYLIRMLESNLKANIHKSFDDYASRLMAEIAFQCREMAVKTVGYYRPFQLAWECYKYTYGHVLHSIEQGHKNIENPWNNKKFTKNPWEIRIK